MNDTHSRTLGSSAARCGTVYFYYFRCFYDARPVPLTQNSGDATADRRVMPCSTGRLLIVINGECLALTGICALLSVILAITILNQNARMCQEFKTRKVKIKTG